MKYHELIKICNRVCNGVDKSSNPVTKQMCMNYIHLAIRKYLQPWNSGDGWGYRLEKLKLQIFIEKYIIKIWYN